MADILSQSEIDALLKDAPSDIQIEDQSDAARAACSPYDFKHPNRVSKDQLRNLRTIHETYCRLLGTYLTTLLRTIVDIQLISIDQVTFVEFTMAMSNPGCIWIFDVPDHDGKGILEVSPAFIGLLIDRLFGGEGKGESEMKTLSIIEQNVAGKIIEKFLQIYEEAWEKAVPVKMNLIKFEMNPQFVQIAPASEIAIVTFAEIKVYDATFPVNICFPYFVLDPIIQELSTDSWIGHSQGDHLEEVKAIVEKTLKNSEVDLVTYLGETKLSVREILALKTNDVIVFDSSIDDLVKVNVGDRTRFLGTVGVSGRKLAISIEEVLFEEEELQDEK